MLWYAVSHCAVHFHWWLFSNNWFKGCTTVDRLGKNLCSNWLAPGTTSLQPHCMGEALSKLLPLSLVTCGDHGCQYHVHRGYVPPLKNLHFVLLALYPWACKWRETSSRSIRYSSSFFPVMIISSRIQLLPDVPSHTWSMVHLQIASAEVMPNTS